MSYKYVTNPAVMGQPVCGGSSEDLVARQRLMRELGLLVSCEGYIWVQNAGILPAYESYQPLSSEALELLELVPLDSVKWSYADTHHTNL